VWRSVSQAALLAESVEHAVNRLSRRAMIATRCAPPLALLTRATIASNISPAAYAAIAATLPGSVGVEPQRSPNGDYRVWLEPTIANRLAAMRRPGESYSEVILRLGAG
jgi:hypothetical protein